MEVQHHVISGNHDLAPSREYAEIYPGMEDWEDVLLIDTNFGRVFGEKGLRESFSIAWLRSILFSLRNEDREGQLEWVEAQLNDSLRLLFTATTLWLNHEAGFLRKLGVHRRIQSVRERLVEIITRREGQVPAYFCGHQHINSWKIFGKTEQVETGALGACPFCWCILEITKTCISLKTRRLRQTSG